MSETTPISEKIYSKAFTVYDGTVCILTLYYNQKSPQSHGTFSSDFTMGTTTINRYYEYDNPELLVKHVVDNLIDNVHFELTKPWFRRNIKDACRQLEACKQINKEITAGAFRE